MHLVGHPRPVNPGRQLGAVAPSAGWPVVRFTPVGGPAERTPGGAHGARRRQPARRPAPPGYRGLLRWDKRGGHERRLRRLARHPAAPVNGVKVRVVTGREHLGPRVQPCSSSTTATTSTRSSPPASSPRLHRRRQEGARAGPDHGHGRSARSTSSSSTGTTRRGASSSSGTSRAGPEGPVRADRPGGHPVDTDGKLGPFKKGAFRMAMATGLPIIPIVIRNAEVIGDRDATIMRPGTVDVAVLHRSRSTVGRWAS